MSDYTNETKDLKNEVEKIHSLAEIWARMTYEYALSLKKNGVKNLEKYPISTFMRTDSYFQNIMIDREDTPIDNMLENCAYALRIADSFHKDEQSIVVDNCFEFEADIECHKEYEGEFSVCEGNVEGISGLISIKNYKLRSKDDYLQISKKRYFDKICRSRLKSYLKEKYDFDAILTHTESDILYRAKTDEHFQSFLEGIQYRIHNQKNKG